MATEPKTYRVSAEVDGEISRLAKIHGGVDKALRKVLLEPAESEIARNSTSNEEENQATRHAQAEAALQMQQAQGRVQPSQGPKNGRCHHCGNDFELLPGAPVTSICRECVVAGHRAGVECRKCAEREYWAKKAAKDPGADPSIDYSAFDD